MTSPVLASTAGTPATAESRFACIPRPPVSNRSAHGSLSQSRPPLLDETLLVKQVLHDGIGRCRFLLRSLRPDVSGQIQYVAALPAHWPSLRDEAGRLLNED